MATIRDSTQAYDISNTTLTIPTPAGATTGDVLVAILGHDTAATLSASSGSWGAALQNSAEAMGGQVAMFAFQLSGAPDADYTFTTAGGAANFMGALVCIDAAGATLGTPSTSIVGAPPASQTTAAVTGAVDPTVLVCGWYNDATATVTTPPATMTSAEFVDGSSADLAVYTELNVGEGSITRTLVWSTATNKVAVAGLFPFTAGGDTAALTGTAASGLTEQRVRDGGYTLIATLTGDTFVAAGATFDAQRQAIINGLNSAQAEAAGWDAVVTPAIPVTSVARTSDTVCTITLPACMYPLVTTTYQITATETVTWTLPAAALTGGVAIVVAPTFTITRGAMDLVQPVGTTNASGVPSTSSGSLTGDVAQLTRVTATIDGVTLDTVRVITTR